MVAIRPTNTKSFDLACSQWSHSATTNATPSQGKEKQEILQLSRCNFLALQPHRSYLLPPTNDSINLTPPSNQHLPQIDTITTIPLPHKTSKPPHHLEPFPTLRLNKREHHHEISLRGEILSILSRDSLLPVVAPTVGGLWWWWDYRILWEESRDTRFHPPVQQPYTIPQQSLFQPINWYIKYGEWTILQFYN